VQAISAANAIVIDFSGRLPETVSATGSSIRLEGRRRLAGNDIGGVQSDYRALYREYIHLLFPRPTPRADLVRALSVLADIRVAAPPSLSASSIARTASRMPTTRAFNLALIAFPPAPRGSVRAGDATPGGRDGVGGAVLCVWGSTEVSARTKPFSVSRTGLAREPVTEMMFRHHFKDLRQMLLS
jgi:hypothetical protein